MLALLLACTPPDTTPGPSTHVDSEVEIDSEVEPVESRADSEPPEDSDPPEVTEETVPDQDVSDDWIFDDGVIHEIELTLDTTATDGLVTAPHTYVSGSVVIDGYELEEVGVRIRGKIGSLRPLSGKPKFKIDLNQFVDDQRFFGIETLSLNAGGVVDCSYVKENLAYELFEAADVAASRTGYTHVTVNGEDYGLYVIIETPDDRLLDRTKENPSGNLYDGKYVWYGGYSYTLLDFGLGVDTLYQLEEGTDVGHADIMAVSTALNTYKGQPSFYSELDKLVDWDQFHRFEAVEQWVGQNDGYAMNRNNYRVYFDPDDGKMEFVPWDFDYSFLYDYQWGRSWRAPTGLLAYWCMQDAACYSERRQASIDIVDIATDLDLVAKHDAMVALIADSVAADPRRECSVDSVVAEQARVRAWLQARNAFMGAFWGF
ncbi:MAG: hypothetical protein GY913_12840 [Proteobacteria bacterium]|nr:hypothetical protein [Pseudomonadota bacterium]MCP4917793.1 hypothetical protein [Pseudomonadota bacterium]